MDEPHDAPGVLPSLGGSGPCPTVTHAGKAWTIGQPTQWAKGALELLTLEVAIANHERALPVLKPARRAEKEKELDAAINGGHYLTWGPLWVAVNSGPDANALFLLSLLRERHPDATLADARALWRDAGQQTARAFAVVVPNFYALLMAERAGTQEEREEMLKQAIVEMMRVLRPLLGDPPTA